MSARRDVKDKTEMLVSRLIWSRNLNISDYFTQYKQLN